MGYAKEIGTAIALSALTLGLNVQPVRAQEEPPIPTPSTPQFSVRDQLINSGIAELLTTLYNTSEGRRPESPPILVAQCKFAVINARSIAPEPIFRRNEVLLIRITGTKLEMYCPDYDPENAPFIAISIADDNDQRLGETYILGMTDEQFALALDLPQSQGREVPHFNQEIITRVAE